MNEKENNFFTSSFTIPDHNSPIPIEEENGGEQSPPSSENNYDDQNYVNQQEFQDQVANENSPADSHRKTNKQSYNKKIGKLLHSNQEKDNIIYQQNLQLQQAEELLRKIEMMHYQQQEQPQKDYAEDETYIYPLSPEPDYEEFEDYNEPEIPASYANFLQRNPWANPNDPHYSSEILNEANEIAEELNKRLKFNKNAEMIGTDQYYQAIEKTLSDQYGVQKEKQGQQKMQQNPSRNPQKLMQNHPVSNGVDRRGMTMADQYMNRYPQTTHNASALDEKTIRMARALKIPDPRNPGSFIPEEQALSLVAESQRYFQENGPDMSDMMNGKISFQIPN